MSGGRRRRGKAGAGGWEGESGLFSGRRFFWGFVGVLRFLLEPEARSC